MLRIEYVTVSFTCTLFWYDHDSTSNQTCDLPVVCLICNRTENHVANQECDLPVVLNHELDLQSNGKSLFDFTTNKS